MKPSELSEEELQHEFIKVEQRYNMLIRITPPGDRQYGPVADIRKRLNEILEEFKRRKLKQQQFADIMIPSERDL